MLSMNNINFNCDGTSISRSEGGDSGVLSVGDKYKIFFILLFMRMKQFFLETIYYRDPYITLLISILYQKNYK